MAGAAKATTDHREIRKWAEAHGGHPAAVKRTGKGEDPGMLRIDFPGFSGKGTLEPISWNKFFEWFDINELALMYRPEDRFNKLVSRSTAHAQERGERPTRARKKPEQSPQQRAAETRKRVEQRRRKASASRSSAKPKGRSTKGAERRSTSRAR